MSEIRLTLPDILPRAADNSEKTDLAEFIRLRTLELKEQGFDHGQASGRAYLERRIQDWPHAWGDSLHILLYGEFNPPERDIEFPSLGITVYHEKVEDSIFKRAHLVLRGEVKVNARNIDGVIDAIRRINTLLGAIILESWGNNALGWWSSVIHGWSLLGFHFNFSPAPTERIIEGVLRLPPQVRRKIDAALYWVREPKNLGQDYYRSELLRLYAAHWSAFECLVEAVNILRPREKLSKTDKQRLIDEFLGGRGGKLTSNDVQECYHEIVNPGLVGNASHALRICFRDEAEGYISECFRRADRHNRLYDIRNAINHGEIDAEHPEELLRIESRLQKLWFIVWRMFGCLIPFYAPVDPDIAADKAKKKDDDQSTSAV
jgi:hypothetical protein